MGWDYGIPRHGIPYGASPDELLMGHKLRTMLPHIPSERNNKGLMKKEQQLKPKQSVNYDKTARRL